MAPASPGVGVSIVPDHRDRNR